MGADRPRCGRGRPGRRVVLALAGLAALAAAAPALGRVTMVPDARNARANKFDIRAAVVRPRGTRVFHTVRTYSSWRSRDLRSTRSKPRAICIYIWKQHSNTKRRQDYEVCAGWKKGKLRAVVFRARSPKRIVGRATARRSSSRSVTFSFERGVIGSPRGYRWQTVTGYTGKGCPKDPPFQFGCDDSAPTGQTALQTFPVPPWPYPFRFDAPLPSPPTVP